MAVAVNTGMTKGEMRKLLMRSKEEPVACAVGIGDNSNIGLMVLHRTKRGKMMESVLKEAVPQVKAARFGTATVDMDDDPKLVLLSLNRGLAGIGRKLVKTLKGTGFTKVRIVTEDGETEAYEEPDEETPEANATATAIPDAPPPPPAGPSPEQRAAQVAALSKMLASLAASIPKAAGNDDARKAMLLKLATDANVNIKTGNLVTAAKVLEQLKQQIAGTEAGATNTVLAKSRLAWTGTRQKVTAEVGRLRAALDTAYAGEELGGEVLDRFDSTVRIVLDKFDDQLGDVIDSVMAETDENRRDELVTQARSLVQDTLAFIEGDELIADLDANPFAPLAIRSTAAATLGALARTIH